MMRVLLVQRRLPHYRVAMFDLLRARLALQDVQLELWHGHPSASELRKRDEGQLNWARALPTTWYGPADRIVWQPFDSRGFDLVIVSQENRLIFNHWLCRPWRHFRLAFWGHGANLGASSTSTLRERFKRFTTLQADWWFAYSAISLDRLAKAGFPSERVTLLNNATDTRQLRVNLGAMTPPQRDAARAELGLTPGCTAVFIGSLYQGKGLQMLIEAAVDVSRTDPRFRLLVVGDGPSRDVVRNAASPTSPIRWLGPLHGSDKARVMALSDFLVMPSAVGLSIVDGFAAGLPLLTTDQPGHGPEFAYLKPGINGEATAPSAADLAAAIRRLLHNPAQLRQWQDAAWADGSTYTIEGMADRFAQGIVSALKEPK